MVHYTIDQYEHCLDHLGAGFATCGALLEKRDPNYDWSSSWPSWLNNNDMPMQARCVRIRRVCC